jgi:adenine deaminase
MSDLHEFIMGMPKAELHMHLEGALEPSLVRTIAERNHLAVPPLLPEQDSSYNFHDLTSFLAVYYPVLAVLQTRTDFHDLAWSYLTKAHAQHIVHAELFFDPQAHTSRGIDFATVISGYHSAITAAREKFDLSASLIMCFLRDRSADSAMQILTQALPYRDQIIGIGLDSDERDNPPRKFAAVFARARKEGFRLTLHCDVDQPDSIEHIRQAVEEIGVDRIDHGTNVVEDAGLVRLLAERGIGLTCCPVSNAVVAEDFKGKEMVRLLRDEGVRVTVNSDDPAYFRAYLSENIGFLAEKAALTREDVVRLQRNAFEIAWITEEERAGFIAVLEEYVASH